MSSETASSCGTFNSWPSEPCQQQRPRTITKHYTDNSDERSIGDDDDDNNGDDDDNDDDNDHWRWWTMVMMMMMMMVVVTTTTTTTMMMMMMMMLVVVMMVVVMVVMVLLLMVMVVAVVMMVVMVMLMVMVTTDDDDGHGDEDDDDGDDDEDDNDNDGGCGGSDYDDGGDDDGHGHGDDDDDRRGPDLSDLLFSVHPNQLQHIRGLRRFRIPLQERKKGASTDRKVSIDEQSYECLRLSTGDSVAPWQCVCGLDQLLKVRARDFLLQITTIQVWVEEIHPRANSIGSGLNHLYKW